MSGFHSVDTFINQPVHPATDNVPIPAYVAGVLAGNIPAGTTPLQVADQIEARAGAVFASAETFSRPRATPQKAELEATLNDLLLMANLGQYYAAKIRGATELALFRETHRPEHQAKAIEHLTLAAQRWNQYSQRARAAYRNPLWTNRVGIVDWNELDAEVQKDVELARGSKTAAGAPTTSR